VTCSVDGFLDFVKYWQRHAVRFCGSYLLGRLKAETTEVLQPKNAGVWLKWGVYSLLVA
jgi:hypothetical protein